MKTLTTFKVSPEKWLRKIVDQRNLIAVKNYLIFVRAANIYTQIVIENGNCLLCVRASVLQMTSPL